MTRAHRRTSPAGEAIRQGAPLRAPTVRALAAFANHTDCSLAVLGFGAGVDYDALLRGTPHEAPYGQSSFALARGTSFERRLKEHNYAPMLGLLREKLGFELGAVSVANLRDGYPRNYTGLVARAVETRRRLDEILRGDPVAPNLVDGAVLRADIGGARAYFEADALATRYLARIHVGEIKSFPIVDGRADPEKAGVAFDQAAVYIYLTRHAVVELGGDPERVSSEALLIAPRNVGLTPTLERQDVSRRIARIGQLLAQVPDPFELAASLPAGLGFGSVAQGTSESRVAALGHLADQVGTTFKPECLQSCGLWRYCRERAYTQGLPAALGPDVVRLLPGVRSLGRAVELAAGAPPGHAERSVAPLLVRTQRLCERHQPPEARAAGGAGA